MRSLAVLGCLLTAYLLLRGMPGGWHAGLRTALAAVVVGFGILAWRPRTSVKVARITTGKPISSRSWAVLFGGVILMEILLWGVLGTMPRHLESAAVTFNEWLRPGTVSVARGGGDAEKQRTGGHWLINRTRMRPLPERTNLTPGNRPEVFVRPEQDAAALVDTRLYVHAFALSEFRDGAWRVASQGNWEIPVGEDGWTTLSERQGTDPIQCRVYHSSQKGGENLVIGLQGLESVEVSGVKEVDSGLHLLPPVEEGAIGYQYDVRSSPRVIDDLVGKEVSLPEEIPSRLLELPDGVLGFRIADLARLVQGEGDLVERLIRIRNHLRTTLDYSLVIENPQQREPLENFLFHEQRGHCEFFATAGALLARAAGVPSRVCYGWSGGTYYEVSGYYVFRASEAHAWTEVFFDELGWVVLDPTPPGGLVAAEPRVAGENELLPGLDLDTADQGSVVEGGRVLLPLLLLVVILPVSWWMLGRTIRRRSQVQPGTFGTDSRSARYRELFLKGCRARGVRMSPGATLRSLGEALEESPGFLDELMAYHYGVAYEGLAPDEGIENSLEKALGEWARKDR